MKLSDLDARFVVAAGNNNFRDADSLDLAEGVLFQCPACAVGCEPGEEDGRRFVRGAHYVLLWFKGRVQDGLFPGPGRWEPSGTGIADLTLSPSVNLDVGQKGDSCRWHGWVKNGEAT